MSSIVSNVGTSYRLLFTFKKTGKRFTTFSFPLTSRFSSKKSSSNELKIDSIQKSWASSIITQNNNNKTCEANNSTTPKFFSRKILEQVTSLNSSENPPIIINHQNTSKSKPVVVNRRRKMTDNAWTNQPIDDKLIWVDCEMTGLDYNKEMIMEIGCIITDANLEEIARIPSIIIHVPEEKLAGMGAWCLKHHGDSGLSEACRKSTITSEEVDIQLLNFVQKYTTKMECPMAGNTIFMDRIFIEKQLPQFHSHFHYRNVDVSTIKELTRRWFPIEYLKAPKKNYSHRVLDDILDSIAELKYYRSSVFRNTNQEVENTIKEKTVQ